jgi:hypothetical protein
MCAALPNRAVRLWRYGRQHGRPRRRAGSPGTDAGTCAKSFDSTYAAIQSVIFEAHGCTASPCHGDEMRCCGVGVLMYSLDRGASWARTAVPVPDQDRNGR